MVWAKIDDEILDNPKISRAGPLGFALHVAAITWCCRNLTDGFIPYSRVNCLLDFTPPSMSVHDTQSEEAVYRGADPIEIAEWLVECGLWHQEAGGFRLNDFLSYNPSKAKVLAERERARAKKPGGSDPPKAKPRQSLAGTSAEPPPKLHGSSDGPVPVPVPVPSPPVGGDSARSGRFEIPRDEPLTDARRGRVGARVGTKAVTLDPEAEWAKFVSTSRGNGKLVASVDDAWESWLIDAVRFAERDRLRESDRKAGAAKRYADHTPKYERPTGEQAGKFQAELKRRLEEEAKKGAA